MILRDRVYFNYSTYELIYKDYVAILWETGEITIEPSSCIEGGASKNNQLTNFEEKSEDENFLDNLGLISTMIKNLKNEELKKKLIDNYKMKYWKIFRKFVKLEELEKGEEDLLKDIGGYIENEINFFYLIISIISITIGRPPTLIYSFYLNNNFLKGVNGETRVMKKKKKYKESKFKEVNNKSKRKDVKIIISEIETQIDEIENTRSKIMGNIKSNTTELELNYYKNELHDSIKIFYQNIEFLISCIQKMRDDIVETHHKDYYMKIDDITKGSFQFANRVGKGNLPISVINSTNVLYFPKTVNFITKNDFSGININKYQSDIEINKKIIKKLKKLKKCKNKCTCFEKYFNSKEEIVIECDDTCECRGNCNNKNIQRGQFVNLEMYFLFLNLRFFAGVKGWGVRTLQDLKKNTFIEGILIINNN
jgi:hypothetical protein